MGKVIVRDTIGGIEVVVQDKRYWYRLSRSTDDFSTFAEQHKDDTRKKGTGIGLSITRHIMRAHGVESRSIPNWKR